MSLQVFLQARLTGIERFLAESSGDLEPRIRWISLFMEVLPRALLAELGLSRMLLGTSGGGQFLLVLPAEARERAQELLDEAARAVDASSEGALRLLYASTENLGDWSDVRKRLAEVFQTRMASPAAHSGDVWMPFLPANKEKAGLFEIAPDTTLRETSSVGWSHETPAVIRVPEGTFSWPLAPATDGVPFARHAALDDEGSAEASLVTLAARAAGRKTWGVLRGDVDGFETRLHRAQTVEEHIQLSIMYKQFFASELEMLCSMPEFFRKVTLLGTGGADFAVCGSWDALIPFARELQRLFTRFVDATVRELAGAEGKTITMAMSVAEDPDETLASVFRECGNAIQRAKAAGKDSLHVFDRTLDWKQVGDASDSRTTMVRLVAEFGCSPQFLYELASFYRGAATDVRRGARIRNDRVERPWRFHRRLNRVIGEAASAARSKEFQRLRSDLISDFTGRNAAQIRLRPAGRVALEWAHLETEA